MLSTTCRDLSLFLHVPLLAEEAPGIEEGLHCAAVQACFLTRGDLYISWERGRDTFDRLLIDGDPSINSGNWM